jgi:ribose transport system substrate-binding protein
MRKLKFGVVILLAMGIIFTFSMIPGCKSIKTETTTVTTETTTTEATSAAETTKVAMKAYENAPIDMNDFVTKNKNGVKAVMADVLKLTDAEKETIRSKNLKVAWLYGEVSEWSKGLGNGSQKAIDELNMKLIFTGDAKFDPANQITNLEDALTAKPDIILSLVVDPVSETAAFKKAAQSGVVLSFVDEVPEGFVHGVDYAGVVTGDLVNMGKYCAEMLGNSLGGKGKIGFLYYDTIFWNTNAREHAAIKTFETEYPNIEIVANKGVVTYDDNDLAARAIITQNPDIAGLVAPWDGPANVVASACKAVGRPDIKITTFDLGAAIALDMLKGGNIVGISAESTADCGYYMVMAAAYKILGKETPEFMDVKAYKVTADNVLRDWEEIIGSKPPEELANFKK